MSLPILRIITAEQFSLHGNLLGVLGAIVQVQDELIRALGARGAAAATAAGPVRLAGGVVGGHGHVAQGRSWLLQLALGLVLLLLLGTRVENNVVGGVGRLSA